MTDPMAERVLCVPAATPNSLIQFQGFCSAADRYLSALLQPTVAAFRPRSEVEDDPTWKQIIPYVIFRCRDEVFCYTRGKSGGEDRLKRLRSLGVGGHVSEEDCNGLPSVGAYEMALNRELAEEVDCRSDGVMNCVGLINDDSNLVGRVHLGVVHVYDLERPAVRSREDALANADFLPIGLVRLNRDSFEPWSQICIDSVL